MNQAEHWLVIEMLATDNCHRATISGTYTDTPYPLQYYFELRDGLSNAWLYPGIALNLAGPPYFVVRAER